MLGALAGLKTQIIITSVVAVITFSAGFYTKAQFVKAAQATAYQKALKDIEALNVKRRELSQELENEKKSRQTSTARLQGKIASLVSNNPECNLTGESVGLLNLALSDSLSSSLGGSTD